eukprot:CAMPEP_0183713062 /NCGR_PEP_ID=MMETSP0737-20130205/8048_1 /TAXON_ID=385413 /ORGANISM="Thalassiosira miniscula, Strain CCMP1093" /LENGTH=383 /DNA_ID=CAMNT_0025941811 /DNA_START=313 /DNA_END=1460 /DNA_ORIENTATION=+
MGPGSSGDYLNNLSANNEQDDEQIEELATPSTNGRSKSPMANVKSAFSSVSNEVEKQTSKLTSGFVSVAERGSSEIQSLASTAKSGAKGLARKGSRDFQRTTLGAQKAVKKTTDGLANSMDTMGRRGLSDMHFFEDIKFDTPEIKFDIDTNAPKVKAEEIVRWIDSQAKSGTEMVGSAAKSGTEMVGSTAKTLVLNFTGKKEYRFGDVTKELIHRVASQEVNMQDTILLLKILLALGATITPMAELLPFTFLIEALNLSLEQKVGGKILEVLSKTLDSRLVAALFTSDDKNVIGDVVKRTVLSGVLEFTGKSTYESGDIQRAVQQGQNENATEDMKLDVELNVEFEEWDRIFVEKMESSEEYMAKEAKIMDMKIAMALEECEA